MKASLFCFFKCIGLRGEDFEIGRDRLERFGIQSAHHILADDGVGDSGFGPAVRYKRLTALVHHVFFILIRGKKRFL